MRKTDKLAQEKFNGDIKQAIKFILWNYKYEELDEYVVEWDKKETRYAYDLIRKAPVIQKENEKSNSEKDPAKTLQISKKNLINSKKNPYKAELAKKILTLLIVNGGIISFAAVLKNTGMSVNPSLLENLAYKIPSIITGVFSLDIGSNVIKYFQFKKSQKAQNTEYETKEGKSL